MLIPLDESVKGLFDLVFGGITVAALLAIIPHITAMLSLVWVVIRLWETKTIQRWLGRKVQDGD